MNYTGQKSLLIKREGQMKKVRKERKTKQKLLIYDKGKIYFSRETERKFYFILTLAMLLSGLLSYTGLL